MALGVLISVLLNIVLFISLNREIDNKIKAVRAFKVYLDGDKEESLRLLRSVK